MTFDLKVAVDLAPITSRLADAAETAERVVAEQVMKDTDPYTPMLTGNMRSRTRAEGNKVIYPGPMSQYLYYGKLMVDPETGSAFARKNVRKVLTDKNLVFNHSSHADAQSFWFEASKAQNLEKWVRAAEKAVAKYGT